MVGQVDRTRCVTLSGRLLDDSEYAEEKRDAPARAALARFACGYRVDSIIRNSSHHRLYSSAWIILVTVPPPIMVWQMDLTQWITLLLLLLLDYSQA